MAILKYESFIVNESTQFEGTIEAIEIIIKNVDARASAYVNSDANVFTKRLKPDEFIKFGDISSEHNVNEDLIITGKNVHVTVVKLNETPVPLPVPVINQITDSQTGEEVTTQTTELQITGINFGEFDSVICKIEATEDITININEWNDTTIKCEVEGLSEYGNFNITLLLNCVNGSATFDFIVGAIYNPIITSVIDAITGQGVTTETSQILIKGSGFGDSGNDQYVEFISEQFSPNGVYEWSDTEILCHITQPEQTGNPSVRVQNRSNWSEWFDFIITEPLPLITSVIDPVHTVILAGETNQISIEGQNFGDNTGSININSGGSISFTIQSWSDTEIILGVSNLSASMYSISITDSNDTESNTFEFEIFEHTQILNVIDAVTGLAPVAGCAEIQIQGVGFWTQHPASTLIIENEHQEDYVIEWSNNDIRLIPSMAPLPSGIYSIQLYIEQTHISATYNLIIP